jgi:hypothetical protein
MDNRKKVFKHGGRLRIVPGLFEITAIYVHYLLYLSPVEDYMCYITYLIFI